MRGTIIGTLCALALSSCVSVNTPVVPAGRYSNHREMAYSQMQNLSWKGVPIELQRDMRTCIVDTAYAIYTPQEIERLDRYARGEQHLSNAEFRQVESAMLDRVGGSKGAAAVMRATCPRTIERAKEFGADPSLKLEPGS